MPFIRTVSPKEATGIVKEIYKEFQNHPPPVVTIFSIRPDLMKAFNESGNAHFWSPTPLPPKLRQLIVVLVSKANSCPFCFESHSIFLQALGFPRSEYRKLMRLAENAEIDDLTRKLSEFCRRASANIVEIGASDTKSLRHALGEEGNFVEAVWTIALFNWINRVVNASGVYEIPGFLKTTKPFFSIGLGWLHPATRILRKFLTPRNEIPSPDPKEILRATDSFYRDKIGFNEAPPLYRVLALRPIQMGAWANLARALLGDGMLPLETKVMIANVAARIDGYGWLVQETEHWLKEQRTHAGNARLEKILRLAEDISTQSYKITERRIDELRNEGLGDDEILEAVCVASFFNGESRLYRCLA